MLRTFLLFSPLLLVVASFGSIANALLYFVITIFILVTLHEFGHFISARSFGMHVPVFSVGMGQRVFGWNKINGFTFGALDEETEGKLGANTDYRLSLLPIGGYAKIDGMIDETQTAELSERVHPWEFRAKPWWQKSIVISAGVIMNALLAWFIFGSTAYMYGADKMMESTVGYVRHGSLADKVGMQAGDKIIAINGEPTDSLDWQQIVLGKMIAGNFGRDFWVTAERKGQEVSLHFPHIENLDSLGIEPRGFTTATIGNPTAGSPAESAGLKSGDIITRIGTDTIVSTTSLVDHIHESGGKAIMVSWRRGDSTMTASITPEHSGDGAYQIGIPLGPTKFDGPQRHLDYGLVKSASVGYSELAKNTELLAKNIGLMIAGKVSVRNSVGGPIKIAQMAGQSASGGPEMFFSFMALLSISLAFLNILPVPALDGGHLLIIWIEAILGRELSQKFKLGFQKIGVALLLSLMVFMVFNDVRNLF